MQKIIFDRNVKLKKKPLLYTKSVKNFFINSGVDILKNFKCEKNFFHQYLAIFSGHYVPF